MTLFADDIILYTETPKDSTHKKRQQQKQQQKACKTNQS